MSDTDFKADFGERYEVLRYLQACVGSPETIIGRKNWCRFCGCEEPSKFRNKAHVIPEALGNHWLIAFDECDDCNSKFSEYESNLVAAMRPILTVSGTAGKANKVGQTGRTDGSSVIRHSRQDNGMRRLQFQTSMTGAQVEFVSPGKLRMSFPVAPVPFKPRQAYKALSKMGYALLPETELSQFSKLRQWLYEKNDSEEFPCLEVGISFGSIGNAPPVVSAALLRRTDPSDQIPYMMFLLCAGSVCLMIDLMSDQMEDHLTWGPMGLVDIRWSVALGPNRETRIEYGKFHPMNWSAHSTMAQPIEKLVLDFDTATTQGRFSTIFRSEWN